MLLQQTDWKCPLFVVDVVVGMRTEAKPCSLGRSVSAHPNERRSHLLLGNRCPHGLVGLAPRMVFFRLPHAASINFSSSLATRPITSTRSNSRVLIAVLFNKTSPGWRSQCKRTFLFGP